MATYCHDCGESVDPDDRFCYYCGEQLPGADSEGRGRSDRTTTDDPPDGGAPDHRCPDCGEPAGAADRFCFYCGEPLPERTPGESPAASEAAPDAGRRCPDCETAVDREDEFCYYCGEMLP